MYVFSVSKGKKLTLSEVNFERLTNKEYPYMRMGRKDYVYHAICPECGNPIDITNLYCKEKARHNGKIVTHARHSGGPVSGFAFYNEEDKKNCPLYKPTPLGDKTVRDNEIQNDDLRLYIEKHRDEILKDLQKITGLNLSQNVLATLFNNFMIARAYRYRAVNKYNIPYCVMYYQQPFTIYGQYIHSADIMNAFKSKGQSVELVNGQIKRKPNTKNFATVKLVFSNYRRQNEKQFLRMSIYEESASGRKGIIYRRVLEMTEFVYE